MSKTILSWMAALVVLTALSGCGCALDKGEAKDTSYFEGCWNHLRDSAKNK